MLAGATNLGLERMARASSGVSHAPSTVSPGKGDERLVDDEFTAPALRKEFDDCPTKNAGSEALGPFQQTQDLVELGSPKRGVLCVEMECFALYCVGCKAMLLVYVINEFREVWEAGARACRNTCPAEEDHGVGIDLVHEAGWDLWAVRHQFGHGGLCSLAFGATVLREARLHAFLNLAGKLTGHRAVLGSQCRYMPYRDIRLALSTSHSGRYHPLQPRMERAYQSV